MQWFRYNWGRFHKTFFFVTYGQSALIYSIVPVYVEICGQNLAANKILKFTDP